MHKLKFDIRAQVNNSDELNSIIANVSEKVKDICKSGSFQDSETKFDISIKDNIGKHSTIGFKKEVVK